MNYNEAKHRLCVIIDGGVFWPDEDLEAWEQQDALATLREHPGLAREKFCKEGPGLLPLAVLFCQRQLALSRQELQEIFDMYPEALDKRSLRRACVNDAPLAAIEFIVENLPESVSLSGSHPVSHLLGTPEPSASAIYIMDKMIQHGFDDFIIHENCNFNMHYAHAITRLLPHLTTIRIDTLSCPVSLRLEPLEYVVNFATERKLNLEFTLSFKLDFMFPAANPMLKRLFQSGANIYEIEFSSLRREHRSYVQNRLQCLHDIRDDIVANGNLQILRLRHVGLGDSSFFNEFLFEGEKLTSEEYCIPKLIIKDCSVWLFGRSPFITRGSLFKSISIAHDFSEKRKNDWITSLAHTFLGEAGDTPTTLRLYDKRRKFWEGSLAGTRSHDITRLAMVKLLADLQEISPDDDELRQCADDFCSGLAFQLQYLALHSNVSFIYAGIDIGGSNNNAADTTGGVGCDGGDDGSPPTKKQRIAI